VDFGVQFGTHCSGVLRQVGVLEFFFGRSGVEWWLFALIFPPSSSDCCGCSLVGGFFSLSLPIAYRVYVCAHGVPCGQGRDLMFSVRV
jgi:hypothetical protein